MRRLMTSWNWRCSGRLLRDFPDGASRAWRTAIFPGRFYRPGSWSNTWGCPMNAIAGAISRPASGAIACHPAPPWLSARRVRVPGATLVPSAAGGFAPRMNYGPLSPVLAPVAAVRPHAGGVGVFVSAYRHVVCSWGLSRSR